jgi:phosphate transport system permease protein
MTTENSNTVKVIRQGDDEFLDKLRQRQQRSKMYRALYFSANAVGLIALIILLLHVANSSFGYVIIRYNVQPTEISDRPLEELTERELVALIIEQRPQRLNVMIRDRLSRVEAQAVTTSPLSQVLAGYDYPEEWSDLTINDLEVEQRARILSDNLNIHDIHDLIVEQILEPRVIKNWKLFESWFDTDRIREEAAELYPNDEFRFYSWLSLDFITRAVSSSATTAGLRTAMLGSVWIIGITILVAFPVGIGAAIYLEEYAEDNRLNRIIEINIRNLAAVPSIIYGMLGLAVFALALREITSGAIFGVGEPSGRTVISAALTLALLILPVIIIQSQEAIRAVPSSIRDGSYSLGATKWQTVSRQVLPIAFPGILTGIILAMSRAVGETAPLLVVGASTFIGVDPDGPFSKFTVVPIQIYQWTARPEEQFRAVAAAAIIVLLIVMVLLNGTAIVLRNRLRKRLA